MDDQLPICFSLRLTQQNYLSFKVMALKKSPPTVSTATSVNQSVPMMPSVMTKKGQKTYVINPDLCTECLGFL